MDAPEDLRGRQAAFNASSDAQWETFAPHRQRVSARLAAGADPSGRLCVLGAGNANDLDLPALLAAYREVHLVDLDAAALARGAARQGVSCHPGLCLHGRLDVTGTLDAQRTWTPGRTLNPADLAALADWPAARAPLALPGPFDRVASTCLLSQIINTVCHALGPTHPQISEAVRATRAGHLRLLARLTVPTGAAVLVSDVLSSDRVPELSTVPEESLPAFLKRTDRSDFLVGVHPSALLTTLRDDPVAGPKLSALEPAALWRWRLHTRDYLVWAVTCRFGTALFSPGPRTASRWP